jgi:hypothetical protein
MKTATRIALLYDRSDAERRAIVENSCIPQILAQSRLLHR